MKSIAKSSCVDSTSMKYGRNRLIEGKCGYCGSLTKRGEFELEEGWLP